MYTELLHQDKIILPDMRFTACHGVLDEEHRVPQEFSVGVVMYLDTTTAAETDDVADTVNYADVYAEVERVMLGAHHNLLESLASQIAHTVLANELVQRVEVRLEKVAAPMGGGVPAIVEIERTAADYGVL